MTEEIDHYPERQTIACYGFRDEAEKQQAVAEAKKYVSDNGYTAEDVKIVIDGGDCVLVVTKREIKWRKKMTLDELKDIQQGQKLQLGIKGKTHTAEFIRWSSDKRLLVVRKYNGTGKQNPWSNPMSIHPSEIFKIGAAE